MPLDLQNQPHSRKNILTGEWALVSPQRNKRPWQGKREKVKNINKEPYDAKCYLCPNNTRSNGRKNPDYQDTFVFENDFPALLKTNSKYQTKVEDLLYGKAVSGECRVICFSARHDLSLAEMDLPAIEKVVDLWATQAKELGQNYNWVQIFENKGEIVGCSNSHPHGQIWASDFLPNEIIKEGSQQLRYYKLHKSPMLLDYLRLEQTQKQRIVEENDYWIVVVPYWAYWPFETLVLPKRHVLGLPDLSKEERSSLAEILKKLLTRYDNLFQTSFPYMSGWHAAPHDGKNNEHWQLHAHYYPPLLRSAKVQKFVASYEWLAQAQRDITAERAAELLRECSVVHYKENL